MLTYPVYAWLLRAFVAPEVAGPHPLLAAGSGSLAVLVALGAGRLAAAWTRAQDPWERFAMGAAAGALAGSVLYAGLGAAAAGIAGQSPLHDILLARADVSPGESTLKLAITVNQTVPMTFGVFWLLVGGGAKIGGLMGWWRPTQPSARDSSASVLLLSLSLSPSSPLPSGWW